MLLILPLALPLRAAEPVAAAQLQPLEIAGKSGVHVFSVELAVTDAERASGLMFRQELPDGQGMLFDFGRDQEVAMWMQNTLIPLDMLFITAGGRIVRIAENTEPMSTRIIPSGGPVRAVLEVIGGTAKKYGIAAGDRVAAYEGAQRLKRAAAQHVRDAGLPLTLNAVVHRQNLAQLPAMIELAVELGAGRLEVAHVQYYGWALPNRAALFPTREQLDAATATVEAARARLRGKLVIDYVVPDYHAELPKACMGGWGRRFLNVTPSGKVLPCHAAETLPGFQFPSVRDTGLAAIWREADAFNRFRGTSWMSEPCRSCERRELDWGGCRCQAFALTGDAAATDPVCVRAFNRCVFDEAIRASEEPPPPFVYRRIGGRPVPGQPPRQLPAALG